MEDVGTVEFAGLCGVHRNTPLNWIDRGMPAKKTGRGWRIRLDQALPWVVTHLADQAASTERERLVRAQADKFELSNEKDRGGLVRRDHMTAVLDRAIADLESVLDGVAGRIANDLAAEDNPAMARKIVLDEHHRIRRIYAENLKTLFERPNDAAKGGEGK